MNGQDGKRAALITGAGKRIGAGIARALAADGWFVHVHYNSSEKEAAETAAEITDSGGACRTVRADLADAGAVAGLIRDCVDAGPPLTCLVNNASRFERDHADDMTVADWDLHLAINLRAPTFLARDLAAHLPADETGCVINLLDNKVFGLNPDYFSYTVGKVGLHGVTRMLAMALAPRVRVCGIAPGITLISGDQGEDDFERTHHRNPLGRGCSPEEIAAAARFILQSPSMTGRTIVLDGGQSLQRAPRDVAFLD
jgi:NAD(P)-dependent dehydrogenase (short-subunit alcohol dehydrogenase family)